MVDLVEAARGDEFGDVSGRGGGRDLRQAPRNEVISAVSACGQKGSPLYIF
jgi:hypothetical protein